MSNPEKAIVRSFVTVSLYISIFQSSFNLASYTHKCKYGSKRGKIYQIGEIDYTC